VYSARHRRGGTLHLVQDSLSYPDPLRFRNRQKLIEIVSTIVRDDLAINETAIRALAAPITAPADLEQLIAMAISELHGLHEGNLARFRLRLSELRRWRGRSA
jgi:hypothetical protein